MIIKLIPEQHNHENKNTQELCYLMYLVSKNTANKKQVNKLLELMNKEKFQSTNGLINKCKRIIKGDFFQPDFGEKIEFNSIQQLSDFFKRKSKK